MPPSQSQVKPEIRLLNILDIKKSPLTEGAQYGTHEATIRRSRQG
jgi:hypothetical protein